MKVLGCAQKASMAAVLPELKQTGPKWKKKKIRQE
jgi:hypothetical protein